MSLCSALSEEMEIPNNINIDDLPGPKRGEYPCLYFQDDIVWSPNHERFALAYSITEASMCNNVGCILWAEVKNDKANILQNPIGVLASCWNFPWCKWINNEVFIFKVQRYNGERTYVPLVAIHIKHGFQVIPDTNITDKWVDDYQKIENHWIDFDTNKLFKNIEKNT